MNNELDFIEKVKLFNEIGGTKNEFNARKAGLYVGLILEEVSELIQSLGYSGDRTDPNFSEAIEFLEVGSLNFKRGDYDNAVSECNRVEFLDAIVDISVVALGAGIAIGADVNSACHAVANNNLEKFEIVDGKHTVLVDENGKIRKPNNFKPVVLKEFVK